MDILQAELSRIVDEWNSHRVRESASVPGGIPEVLYFGPEKEGLCYNPQPKLQSNA